MKIKLSQEPPDWSHMFRRKAHELRGELFEMALGYFICFAFVQRAIAYLEVVVVDDFVALLQGNNNLIGILRVLLPVLLYVAGYVLRSLMYALGRSVARAFRLVLRAPVARFYVHGKNWRRIVRGWIKQRGAGKMEEAK